MKPYRALPTALGRIQAGDLFALTSRLDGTERIYRLDAVTACDCRISSQDDGSSTVVTTRGLVDHLLDSLARPCSPI